MKTLVILTRHTSTNWNAEKRFSGHTDEPRLNEFGIAEARGAANLCRSFLGERTIDEVYSSDLQRAQQTGAVVVRALGLAISVSPTNKLREVCMGEIEGLTKDERKLRFPDEQHPQFVTRDSGYDFTSIGGEKETEIIARHHEFFLELAKSSIDTIQNPPVVLVIGHSIALRSYLRSHNLERGALDSQGTILPLWLDYDPSNIAKPVSLKAYTP